MSDNCPSLYLPLKERNNIESTSTMEFEDEGYEEFECEEEIELDEGIHFTGRAQYICQYDEPSLSIAEYEVYINGEMILDRDESMTIVLPELDIHSGSGISYMEVDRRQDYDVGIIDGPLDLNRPMVYVDCTSGPVSLGRDSPVCVLRIAWLL